MITTDRLILRRWRESDRARMAEMNSDPEVMEYFPETLSIDQVSAVQDRLEATWDQRGICFGAVERRYDGQFIGIAGLAYVDFSVPFEGTLQVGWRLTRDAWGQGYATEAARAWLDHGFGQMNADEIISITVSENTRSRAVMRRLGMSHYPGRDFQHPKVSVGHPLRPHLLYALSSEEHARHSKASNPVVSDSRAERHT